MTRIPIYTPNEREQSIEVQVLGYSSGFQKGARQVTRSRKRRSIRYADKIMNDPDVLNA